MTDNVILSAAGLIKRYGSVIAAYIPGFEVRRGEFFTIVGPSGCGKSTLLGMLTGTVSPSAGRITIAGQDVTSLPPEKRPTSMVFQSLALFPHMSVGQNIGFPLEIRGEEKGERERRVRELLDLLHLPRAFYDKSIKQCSGGERQRVAIARALAHDSEIVFFDEPLSAIDYRLRKTLEVELMEVHEATGKTFVYVTHSLEEAMTMSDRMSIMKAGRVVQTGDAREIYNEPKNEFVAQFLGDVNLFDVRFKSREGDLMTLNCGNPRMDVSARYDERIPASDTGKVIVRPENMKIVRNGEQPDNQMRAVITHRLVLGSRIRFEASVGDKRILVEELSKVQLQNNEPGIRPGDTVTVGWNVDGGILVNE